MDDFDTLKHPAFWAALPPVEKIAILSACRDRVARHADRWTAVAAEIKSISGTPASGEEAITGPWGVMRALDAYVDTLRKPDGGGRQQLEPDRITVRPDGRQTVRVFPNSFVDRLVLPGVTADVWLQRGVPLEEFHAPARSGRVVAVMGAGNITAIGLLDALTKLVNENSVCILKLHPLLAALAPILADAFAPLIEPGYLAMICGDPDVGAALCSHPFVDEVHVTGSTATYRAIAAETSKPITAELGNVTPAIVLPGRWNARDIEYAAEAIVAAKLHNNGYNCVALQVLVLPAQWERRSALLAAIERVMRRAPHRRAYYPASVARFATITAERATLRSFGTANGDYIPLSVVEVDAADTGDSLFTEEAFCPLLVITTIDGDPPEYLRNAVRFCNDVLAGDLVAHIIAKPSTVHNSAGDIDEAIVDLRYGCIGINLWCGAGFLIPQIPWGGAPGNTRGRVGSGVGSVHNSLGLTRWEKTVLRAPLRPLRGLFRPPWFVTQRNGAAIGTALCDYERRASLATLARLLWLTLTG